MLSITGRSVLHTGGTPRGYCSLANALRNNRPASVYVA